MGSFYAPQHHRQTLACSCACVCVYVKTQTNITVSSQSQTPKFGLHMNSTGGSFKVREEEDTNTVKAFGVTQLLVPKLFFKGTHEQLYVRYCYKYDLC